MIRLYIKSPLKETQEIFLSDAHSHYIQNVMRLKTGDTLLLFNGREGEWKGQIVETSKKSVKLLLVSQERPQKTERDLWLCFSPLKPKRQEFLVEKATELGVSCLWPLRFERTSLPKINLEKMQAHCIKAAEQSERLTVPEIKSLISLPSLLKEWPQNRHLLFGDETLNAPFLGDLSFLPENLYGFLVGPEGGLTPQELSLLKAHPQAQGVTLNPHILRSETAALVGISYLQARS